MGVTRIADCIQQFRREAEGGKRGARVQRLYDHLPLIYLELTNAR